MPRSNVSYVVVRIQHWPDTTLDLKEATKRVQAVVVDALGDGGRCVSLGTITLGNIERRMEELAIPK